MMTCPKCHNELEDDMKFCDRCGASVNEIPDSQKPTAPVEEEIVEAPAEEVAVEAPVEEVTEAAPAEESSEAAPAVKKQLPKKAIMLGGIGVAAIAILVLLISLLFGGGKSENYALYLKDEEIFFTDLKKNSEAWQVTSRLVDSDYIEASDLAYERSTLGNYTYMSEDGKYLFFVDKIGDSDEGYNLYFKEVAKPEKDAVKVDSDVRVYTVNTSDTIVTYSKGESHDLYQYQIKDDNKEKIASDVVNFHVSDDGKKIIYQNAEGALYLKNGDEDKEKIASDITSFSYITEDFKTVYFIKDETLYKQVIGKDKEQIASDIYYVVRFYESGEIYYMKNNAEELSLMDYVDDDMMAEDAAISEPVEPAYPTYPDSPDAPSWWDYETTEEYYAAYDEYEIAYDEYRAECDRLDEEYDAAWDQYYIEWDAYNAKAERDSLREELKNATMEASSHTLCYFNGKEEVVISDACYDYYTYAAEEPVIVYGAYSQSNVSKVKLSEIDNYYDVYTMVEEALYSDIEKFIAVEGAATAFEEEKNATNFRINDAGTEIYYIDDIPDEKEYGSLYSITIKKGVPGKAEVYDDDVYSSYLSLANGKDVVYFKDYKEEKGELYINKNKVDYDVYRYSINVDEDGNVFYFTDWNSEKSYGTMKVFEGKEPEKISDDVHNYTVLPDGRVLYLYDYSNKYYKGELNEWKNGKTRKIDEDVVAVLPISDNEISRYRGNW